MVNRGTDAQVLCSPGEVLSSGKRTALSWNRCLEAWTYAAVSVVQKTWVGGRKAGQGSVVSALSVLC